MQKCGRLMIGSILQPDNWSEYAQSEGGRLNGHTWHTSPRLLLYRKPGAPCRWEFARGDRNLCNSTGEYRNLTLQEMIPYPPLLPPRQAIVALRVNSLSGTVVVFGVRGLPAGSNPRDVNYIPSSSEATSSFVATLDLGKGQRWYSSTRLFELAPKRCNSCSPTAYRS